MRIARVGVGLFGCRKIGGLESCLLDQIVMTSKLRQCDLCWVAVRDRSMGGPVNCGTGYLVRLVDESIAVLTTSHSFSNDQGSHFISPSLRIQFGEKEEAGFFTEFALVEPIRAANSELDACLVKLDDSLLNELSLDPQPAGAWIGDPLSKPALGALEVFGRGWPGTTCDSNWDEQPGTFSSVPLNCTLSQRSEAGETPDVEWSSPVQNAGGISGAPLFLKFGSGRCVGIVRKQRDGYPSQLLYVPIEEIVRDSELGPLLGYSEEGLLETADDGTDREQLNEDCAELLRWSPGLRAALAEKLEVDPAEELELSRVALDRWKAEPDELVEWLGGLDREQLVASTRMIGLVLRASDLARRRVTDPELRAASDARHVAAVRPLTACLQVLQPHNIEPQLVLRSLAIYGGNPGSFVVDSRALFPLSHRGIDADLQLARADVERAANLLERRVYQLCDGILDRVAPFGQDSEYMQDVNSGVVDAGPVEQHYRAQVYSSIGQLERLSLIHI